MPEVQRVGRGGETAETEKRETDYSAEQVKWQWIEESQEEAREKEEGTLKESRSLTETAAAATSAVSCCFPALA